MKSLEIKYLEKYQFEKEQEEIERKRVKKLIEQLEYDFFWRDFPFLYLSEEEQLKFLFFILNEMSEREGMANIKKLSLERDYSFFIYEEPSERTDENHTMKKNQATLNRFFLEQIIHQNRRVLGSGELEPMSILQDFRQRYQQESQFIPLQLVSFDDLQDKIFEMTDFLLQFMTYHLLKNNKQPPHYPLAYVMNCVEKLDAVLEEKLQMEKEHWKNNKDQEIEIFSCQEMCKCVAAYQAHTSRYQEETQIKQQLKEEIESHPELFAPVPEDCVTHKSDLIEMDLKYYEMIITEHKKIDQFTKKIKITQDFIKIMDEYGGRNCNPLCLLDLKVYFREIFMSKSGYNKRNSQTIVKQYLKEVELAKAQRLALPFFQKESQYLFVREKISRGYYRECRSSQLYIDKCDFEKRVRSLLTKTYFFYDVPTSFMNLYSLFDQLLLCYAEIILKKV